MLTVGAHCQEQMVEPSNSQTLQELECCMRVLFLHKEQSILQQPTQVRFSAKMMYLISKQLSQHWVQFQTLKRCTLWTPSVLMSRQLLPSPIKDKVVVQAHLHSTSKDLYRELLKLHQFCKSTKEMEALFYKLNPKDCCKKICLS